MGVNHTKAHLLDRRDWEEAIPDPTNTDAIFSPDKMAGILKHAGILGQSVSLATDWFYKSDWNPYRLKCLDIFATATGSHELPWLCPIGWRGGVLRT